MIDATYLKAHRTASNLARSSMQYQAFEKNDDALRYGCRKVAQLLRVAGWPPLGRIALQFA